MIAAALSLAGLAFNLQVVAQNPTQRVVGSNTTAASVPAPTDTSAHAVRASSPPSIDGKEDDQVWRDTPTIKAFREWRPTEDKAPRFPTEAKIAYDASNLYVFVRAIDPHPDSIIKLLERRDSFTASDMIWVFVDSYHDRRTGYEFGVNAAGVKLDQAIYDDGNEDGAWDGVWDVATRIDSAGWTAEFKLPLSQMRYTREKNHTFGIMIDRGVYRYSERYIWPLLRQSKPGFVSQFGSLHGIDDVEAPRKLEAVPYVVAKSASRTIKNAYDQKQSVEVGGDLKY
ncbi:MAG TPA: carbohydrate binding family 9 domain-containing protein, partial [Gemmatimonadaceae bacterium]|nr:carbohydrate binding family 9 domain-containing protein [Gemmatimonadaceae bacterium]